MEQNITARRAHFAGAGPFSLASKVTLLAEDYFSPNITDLFMSFFIVDVIFPHKPFPCELKTNSTGGSVKSLKQK